MKVLVVAEYKTDKATVDKLGKDHHNYLRQFLDNGTLFAAGRKADNGGSVWIVEVDSVDVIDKMVTDDPFHAAGIITGWQTHPLTNWSAKDYKGS